MLDMETFCDVSEATFFSSLPLVTDLGHVISLLAARFAFGDIFLEVDEVEFVRNGCDQSEEHQVGGEDRGLSTHLLHEATFVEML